jgi:membrane protein DedA with SNARE-associated domain
VAARFVPGGRTAATFTTGAAGLRFGAFAGPVLLGAVLWSLYAAGLGYVGGEAFTGSLWMPLAAALVVAGAVAAAGEAYRRLRLAT